MMMVYIFQERDFTQANRNQHSSLSVMSQERKQKYKTALTNRQS